MAFAAKKHEQRKSIIMVFNLRIFACFAAENYSLCVRLRTISGLYSYPLTQHPVIIKHRRIQLRGCSGDHGCAMLL